MNIIQERQIIDEITHIFPINTPVPVTIPLTESLLSDKQLDDLLTALERKYDIVFDPEARPRLDTVGKITSSLNDARGLGKYTIGRMFLETCRRNIDGDAVIFGEDRYSYRRLKYLAESAAETLSAHGVFRAAKTAILLSNSIQYVVSYLALFLIGAITVPVNTRLSGRQAFSLLDDAQCEFIICEERIGAISYGNIISEYANSRETLRKIFYIGENLYGEKGVRLNRIEKGVYLNDLHIGNALSATTEYRNPEPDGYGEIVPAAYDEIEPDGYGKIEHDGYGDIEPAAPALITYTSGATGIPNGVILGHNEIIKAACYAGSILNGDGEGEFPFTIAPLYSAQGYLSLIMNIAFEKPFKIAASLSPNDVLKDISRGGISAIHSSPAIWELLLCCRAIEFTRFGSLRRIMLTGSRCGPALAERIEKKLNCKLINMYGLKEGANVITMTRPDDSDYVRRYSEGRPVPGVEIKIVDENRVEVPRGEVGELTFRGYNMLGYNRRPAKNAAYADAGGWIYTGDMAKYLDGENITVVGRKRDRITHGGFDIYPGEIEECVLQIPQVQSAAAVAAAENINVFVIPKAGAAVNSDEILAHLSQNLAVYMHPDDVRFVSGMPSLLTGTIDKKALADWSENGVPPEYGIFFTGVKNAGGIADA